MSNTAVYKHYSAVVYNTGTWLDMQTERTQSKAKFQPYFTEYFEALLMQ